MLVSEKSQEVKASSVSNFNSVSGQFPEGLLPDGHFPDGQFPK